MTDIADAASNSCTTMPQSSQPSDASHGRKERKRLTDRIAQREHRRRQREYVQELESQLALIQAGSSSDFAALVAENSRLRAELQSLKALWKTVEDLVAKKNTIEQGEPEVAPQHTSPPCEKEVPPLPSSSDVQAPVATTPEATSSTVRFHQAEAEVDVETEANGISDSTLPLPEGDFSATGEAILTPTSPQVSPLSHLTLDGWWPSLHVSHSTSVRPSLLEIDSYNPPSLPHQQTALQSEWHHLNQDDTRSLPRNPRTGVDSSIRSVDGTQTPFSFDDMMDIFRPYLQRPLSPMLPLFPQLTPLPHQKLPLSLCPPMAKDYYLHTIIEKGRASASKPTPADFADFFFDNPENQLSRGLKLYLEPIRTRRRTVEFLATYWVLYLMLRWQINQDEDSYRSLPKWLRPTEAQLSIPHPAAIDLIAWPALREKLLLLSFEEPPVVHEILHAVGGYLEIDISLLPENFTVDPGSVHMAIADIRNWKLQSGFFELYPQLRGYIH